MSSPNIWKGSTDTTPSETERPRLPKRGCAAAADQRRDAYRSTFGIRDAFDTGFDAFAGWRADDWQMSSLVAGALAAVDSELELY
jgi:hypothetical protein